MTALSCERGSLLRLGDVSCLISSSALPARRFARAHALEERVQGASHTGFGALLAERVLSDFVKETFGRFWSLDFPVQNFLGTNACSIHRHIAILVRLEYRPV